MRVLHLSLLVGSDVVGRAGGRIGRVDDLVVRLGGTGYPPVTALLARVAGRDVFISGDAVSDMQHGRVELSTDRIDLRPFERRAQEVLLRKDVLDRQLIDVDGARLRRANDIELARIEGWWRVVGVDVGPRGIVRRVVPRRFARKLGDSQVLDWAVVEPFTGHVPTVRLRAPHPGLARLHPAELADLVEAAGHSEGAEILAAVHADPELEADLFEELDPSHVREYLEERDDREIAGLLARMETDDAVDLLLDLDEERRDTVVALLPSVQRRRVETLLGYAPATAGGLMSPDFVCLYGQASAEEALDRLRMSRAAPETLETVFVMNTQRRVSGAIALADLVRADPQSALSEIAPLPRVVPLDAELEEIARLMTDYDLTVVGVVDGEQRLQGVVTVDDVLELVLPRGWRRRFSLDDE
ncbi:MAG TPA: CBS domain-containing protein [Gaiellaceae bacterium]|nr:CBS domain-containing protein [Gaiellaceae bacterium]